MQSWFNLLFLSVNRPSKKFKSYKKVPFKNCLQLARNTININIWSTVPVLYGTEPKPQGHKFC